MAVSQIKSPSIQSLIDYFFETPSVEELSIKFSEPLRLSKEGYKELIGKPDSVGGVVRDDITLDHFVYYEDVVEEDENGGEKEVRVLAKINVKYEEDDEGNINIFEIYMWRERLE